MGKIPTVHKWQCWARIIFLWTRHCVMLFYRGVMRHRGVFFNLFISRYRCFLSLVIFFQSRKKIMYFRVINILLLKLVSTPTYSPLPLLTVIFHPPPGGQPPALPLENMSPILAVNFHPL